jgi:uncharacterized protein (DUF1697 family)
MNTIKMHKKIAILRGINVGGKRIILMADLKAIFEHLGFIDIVTYIQSGNVIFNTNERSSNIKLSDKIEKAISEKYGFDVPVIIRTAEELKKAVSINPFLKEDEVNIDKLFLSFLKDKPLEEYREKTESYDFSPDRFVIDDKDVFIFCEGKYHKTKLSNNFFESKLKTSATSRNWKTVLKLRDLSG